MITIYICARLFTIVWEATSNLKKRNSLYSVDHVQKIHKDECFIQDKLELISSDK